MQRELSVTEKSFERAGITKDAAEAICEFIWNGFEAGATQVSVDYIGVSLQEAPAICISDNGSGIDYDRIDDSFGAFLASPKLEQTIAVKSQKNKGKGRFSYLAFAGTARWNTTFRAQDGSLQNYTISLDAASKRSYATSDLMIAEGSSTGTIVEIPVTEKCIEEKLCYEKMQAKLLEEFAWYLYLQRDKHIKLTYLGNVVDYAAHIDLELSQPVNITIQNHEFLIDIVVWNNRVDNGSKVYYVADNGTLVYAEPTSFNKNKVDFYHAAVVKSAYLENVMWFDAETDGDSTVISLLPGEQQEIIRELRREVKKLLGNTLQEFLKRKADEHVRAVFEDDIAPRFSDDDYGQLRRKDFERVTREIYCTEPKIFYRLDPIQEKSLLGFLNLLLSSDERENILKILDQVVLLSPEQRANFADILQRTKLEYILDLLNLLQRRNDVIAGLKSIVFDMTKFANERDHIQKVIENNYWIFGEGYRLVTADQEMQTSLRTLEEITGVTREDKLIMGEKEKTDRMDVFLYGSQTTYDGKRECLVVELKAPYVALSPNVYNQIDRYATTVRKEPRFNSMDRMWRFIAIGRTVSEDVRLKYRNFAQYGKQGLAGMVGDFELYALSWDDIFTAYNNRHAFLMEKLQADLQNTAQCVHQDNLPSHEAVEKITAQLLQNGGKLA